MFIDCPQSRVKPYQWLPDRTTLTSINPIWKEKKEKKDESLLFIKTRPIVILPNACQNERKKRKLKKKKKKDVYL